jgi:hypothetical protein
MDRAPSAKTGPQWARPAEGAMALLALAARAERAGGGSATSPAERPRTASACADTTSGACATTTSRACANTTSRACADTTSGACATTISPAAAAESGEVPSTANACPDTTPPADATSPAAGAESGEVTLRALAAPKAQSRPPTLAAGKRRNTPALELRAYYVGAGAQPPPAASWLVYDRAQITGALRDLNRDNPGRPSLPDSGSKPVLAARLFQSRVAFEECLGYTQGSAKRLRSTRGGGAGRTSASAGSTTTVATGGAAPTDTAMSNTVVSRPPPPCAAPPTTKATATTAHVRVRAARQLPDAGTRRGGRIPASMRPHRCGYRCLATFATEERRDEHMQRGSCPHAPGSSSADVAAPSAATWLARPTTLPSPSTPGPAPGGYPYPPHPPESGPSHRVGTAHRMDRTERADTDSRPAKRLASTVAPHPAEASPSHGAAVDSTERVGPSAAPPALPGAPTPGVVLPSGGGVIPPGARLLSPTLPLAYPSRPYGSAPPSPSAVPIGMRPNGGVTLLGDVSGAPQPTGGGGPGAPGEKPPSASSSSSALLPAPASASCVLSAAVPPPSSCQSGDPLERGRVLQSTLAFATARVRLRQECAQHEARARELALEGERIHRNRIRVDRDGESLKNDLEAARLCFAWRAERIDMEMKRVNASQALLSKERAFTGVLHRSSQAALDLLERERATLLEALDAPAAPSTPAPP